MKINTRNFFISLFLFRQQNLSDREFRFMCYLAARDTFGNGKAYVYKGDLKKYALFSTEEIPAIVKQLRKKKYILGVEYEGKKVIFYLNKSKI